MFQQGAVVLNLLALPIASQLQSEIDMFQTLRIVCKPWVDFPLLRQPKPPRQPSAITVRCRRAVEWGREAAGAASPVFEHRDRLTRQFSELGNIA